MTGFLKGILLSTLDFYRKAGYNIEDKTAFIQWVWFGISIILIMAN